MTTPSGLRSGIEWLERRRLFTSVGQLLGYDFNGATAWPTMAGLSSTGGSAALIQGGVGTIDTAGGTTPTGGLRLTETPPAAGTWTSDLNSGTLAVANTEANLGKLTLSFNLSATQIQPVTVRIFSHNSPNGAVTGGLETVIYPAATYYNQRFALDLSTMKASGSGTFNPTAAYVSFDFQIGTQNGWSAGSATQLRLDNVNYSKPAYYVKPANAANPSAGGRDTNNGLTEATAFATPSKAVSVAQAGDVIDVMDGTYTIAASGTGSIHFTRPGTPAAWIVLKNYPGQSPIISSEFWNAIYVGNGSTANPATTPAVAYIEVRGMHVIGDSAKVGPKSAPDGPYDPNAPAGTYGPYGQYIGQVDGRTNGNGISIDGRGDTYKPHDIRFSDNIVEQCSAGGFGGGDCDRVQFEDNVSKDNCYWDIYGTSGFSILSNFNFDGTSGTYTRLVRNNISSGNEHKEMWAAAGKYSDGNGIIIDYNHTSATDVAAGVPYLEALGRTLVTNNVTFNNGGSGIHAYGAYHVDIINNVAYLNSASSHIQSGEMFAGSSGTPDSAADDNIFNNILVAPVAPTGAPAEPVTGGRTGSTIIYKNNVYFGGNIPANTASYNTGNVTADPKFVAPSINAATADFRLQSSSPAINLGVTTSFSPNFDYNDARRYAAPDAGAFEYVPPAPTAITLAAVSDTGVVGDNQTRLNNATAAGKLSFVVSGTLSGATVSLYSAGVLLGTATATGSSTTVTTNGTAALADGAAAITAIQTFASAPSPVSLPLGIVVDTASPVLLGTPVINAGAGLGTSRSIIRTVSWTFSEPVIVGLGNFVLTNLTTGLAVNLASRGVSVSGNVVTLALDTPGTDPAAGFFLADANYRLSLPGGADAAGNPLDANGDGTPGETPTFDFFKLLGDMNGDRNVNFSDFLILQSAFGGTAANVGFNAAADLDASGTVNFSDFLILQSRFGGSLPAVAAHTIKGYVRR